MNDSNCPVTSSVVQLGVGEGVGRVRRVNGFQSPGCLCWGRDGGQRGDKSYVFSYSPSRKKKKNIVRFQDTGGTSFLWKLRY